MTDLAKFLLARIAEDEAVARAANGLSWLAHDDEDHGYGDWWSIRRSGSDRDRCYVDDIVTSGYEGGGVSTAEDAEHIALHDPARALAECDAKRRIVEMQHTPPDGCGGHPGPYLPHDDYGPGYCRRWAEENWVLRYLALPYAEHPDYREEWKP